MYKNNFLWKKYDFQWIRPTCTDIFSVVSPNFSEISSLLVEKFTNLVPILDVAPIGLARSGPDIIATVMVLIGATTGYPV